MPEPIDRKQDSQDIEWPRGPLKRLYFEQLREYNRWHWGLDVEGTYSIESESKAGAGAVFYGDLYKDQYNFFIGYRYLYTSDFTHEFNLGIGKTKNWGDLRFKLLYQMPPFSKPELLKKNWQIGAGVQAVYNLVETNYFRLAMEGETGILTGQPETFGSYLGAGLLIGFKH